MKAKKFTLPKIDHGVPITPRSCGGKWIPFLRKLKNGDSFVVNTLNERGAVMNSASAAKIRITTRKIDGVGYRIWRLDLLATEKLRPGRVDQ